MKNRQEIYINDESKNFSTVRTSLYFRVSTLNFIATKNRYYCINKELDKHE